MSYVYYAYTVRASIFDEGNLIFISYYWIHLLFRYSLVSVTMSRPFLVFFIGLLPLSIAVRINLINCQQPGWHCTNNAPYDIAYSCSNINNDVSTNYLFIFTDKKEIVLSFLIFLFLCICLQGTVCLLLM